MLRRGLRWLLLAPLLGLVPLILLLLAGLYGYQRLTSESVLAELRFEPVAAQQYRASVTWADGCRQQDYLLYGDQWRVDARFIKWHYWAALLGLEPLYRLERLEGRYRRAADANQRPHHAHDIGEAEALDLLQGVAALGRFNPLFDSSYGSSAYADIDLSQRYRLFRAQSGLVIRRYPVETLELTPDGLTITIAHACAESGLQRLAEGFNRWWLAR